ncbi:MAG TPA: asparagine synthase (glutamine-hydrolyzing) [Gemmatimonadaceae bacterium]
MCGIAGLFGRGWEPAQLDAMIARQRHRGPDASGTYADPSGLAALGHNRLSIIDLSDAGAQPMFSHDGRLCIVFNGEIYNYLELRAELHDYPFRSRSDTEVVLAAYERWGEACLDRFVGMFAFLIWDTREQRLFAARDRFGVKPMYYHQRPDGSLAIASEIGTLRTGGVPMEPDEVTWATYLVHGIHEHTARTFWRGVQALPAGHKLTWRDGQLRIAKWYDLAERVGAKFSDASLADTIEEYHALLVDSIRLRFRSDVPVGINLSGGLDSSTLLALVQETQGADSGVTAFTFVTGDPAYDELPWVEQMLARTRHPLVTCRLSPEDVPALAASVQAHQDEPFGGIPTLAYARLFEEARARGVIVLLDGQGMDEQWAGYDYYRRANGADGASSAAIVQGTTSAPTRPECLTPEFAALARDAELPTPFPDALRNLQYRDACCTKIPRALRYNDRVSMRASTELREPFLDHRLFELAFRQPRERKIQGDTGKWLVREMVQRLLPQGVVEAPKRPLQTPQREWLRGPLAEWAQERIDNATAGACRAWLDRDAVLSEWARYRAGEGDNSFFIWQWVNLALAVTTWD